MEHKNRRSKQLVADLSLDKEALKSVTKHCPELVGLRAVAFVQAKHGLSELHALLSRQAMK